VEKHNQVSFFARLSTVSARDVVSAKSDQKDLQVRNGDELITLFLQSERINTSFNLFSVCFLLFIIHSLFFLFLVSHCDRVSMTLKRN
jgi:hypothetical protein